MTSPNVKAEHGRDTLYYVMVQDQHGFKVTCRLGGKVELVKAVQHFTNIHYKSMDLGQWRLLLDGIRVHFATETPLTLGIEPGTAKDPEVFDIFTEQSGG